MVFTTVLILIYAIGAITALATTYIEGERKGDDWNVLRILGLLLCLVWPALVICMVVVLAAASLKSRLLKS